jgi:hypothetical protein
MSRLALLLAATLLSACAGATTDPSPRPASDARIVDARAGENVTLSVGETARFHGGQFAVTFRRVSQDSRCPSTVVCVWAGDGAVQLWMKRGWQSASATVHTLEEPKTAELDGYTVRLIELQPYPASSPIDPAAYFVTLRVDGPHGGEN